MAYYSFVQPGQPRLWTRWERLRYASKVSRLLWESLTPNTNLVLAQPGGSVRSDLVVHAWSDSLDGLMYKPQYGETPAQLGIEGFYILTTNLVPTYSNSSVVLDNRFLYGPMRGRWPAAVKVQQASIIAEVKALKAILDAAAGATLVVYPDCALKTFRIDYKGEVWGDRGFSFPQ
jgi:hypothetical protein